MRTPIGRYGGALSTVRPDDLAALPIRTLVERNASADWQAVDDVILGCANQAGEDNRNVARMALLLAGMPESVPGATINRLCGSGMDALGGAARAIKAGEADFMIAGGVESMSRAQEAVVVNAFEEFELAVSSMTKMRCTSRSGTLRSPAPPLMSLQRSRPTGRL